ncbi:MAG: polysaccharide pyruvyl transferase family protein [Acidobacteria bacterium]|nr:polysaccharide pyruvyl transferase family protein [Acidobacteriota bacterium]
MDAASPLRIAISGSYGGMNLGDEAILEGILTRLRATIDAEVTVLSRNPSDTLERHGVERAIAPRSLTRREMAAEIERVDLLILGGGGILYDRDADEYVREVFLAHELGVPVFVYAISAGPLTHAGSRQAVRDALNASASTVVTVRDRLGLRLLEDVGVTQEIHLTADPAFLLDAEELPAGALREDGVDVARRLVGFSVREPGPAAPDIDPAAYYALLANAADFVSFRYDADVVFVPLEKTDVQHSHGVVAHMRRAERAEILRRRYTPRQLIDVMGHFEFAVGMRLHFCIFATLAGTPFTALPYASKVAGLLEDLEMEMPPLGAITIGQLIARIDRWWDQRDRIRAAIEGHREKLRARAARTNDLLVARLHAIAARRRS